MRFIYSEDDFRRGIETYELADGRMVKFDRKAVRQFGLANLMRSIGEKPDETMLPVMQHGRIVGYLPRAFNSRGARSLSLLYDARPGDFTLDGGKWIASPSLGSDDFLCVDGFCALSPSDKNAP